MISVRLGSVLALLAMGVMLVACSSDSNPFAKKKRPPDAFAVYSRAPLSMPPDYGLRPPDEGGRGSDRESVSTDAESALLGRATAPQGGRVAPATPLGAESPGLLALLQQTGALTADPDIRDQINRETTILADADQSLLDRLMFWSDPVEYGTVVNPVEEARRIRDNTGLGRPVTVGETPTIARRQRALLEGIFN